VHGWSLPETPGPRPLHRGRSERPEEPVCLHLCV
jgi:hypothetical protein